MHATATQSSPTADGDATDLMQLKEYYTDYIREKHGECVRPYLCEATLVLLLRTCR